MNDFMTLLQEAKDVNNVVKGIRHKISELDTGLEIDTAVALYVMNLPRPALPLHMDAESVLWETINYEGWILQSTGYENGDELEILPQAYSSNPRFAMEVFERLRTKWSVNIMGNTWNSYDTFYCKIYQQRDWDNDRLIAWEAAATVELAICKAALSVIFAPFILGEGGVE